jgi:hypothetical protein
MTSKKPKIPKDLGLKIGSPMEILWGNVLQNSEVNLENAKSEVVIAEAMIELAKGKIEEEKEKFK